VDEHDARSVPKHFDVWLVHVPHDNDPYKVGFKSLLFVEK